MASFDLLMKIRALADDAGFHRPIAEEKCFMEGARKFRFGLNDNAPEVVIVGSHELAPEAELEEHLKNTIRGIVLWYKKHPESRKDGNEE